MRASLGVLGALAALAVPAHGLLTRGMPGCRPINRGGAALRAADDKGDGDDFDRDFEARVRGMERLGPAGFDVDPPKFDSIRPPSWFNGALLASVFVVGIGAGVTLDSAVNTNPRDLASRDAVDRVAPNPLVCQKYGSSAMVFDTRMFVTFNPFSVYIAQPDTKPGCVLRPANTVSVLKTRGLLTEEEITFCRNSNNGWGYVGDLADKPQLSCLFQSLDAQNEFLSDPKIGLGEDVYDSERQ